jgi:glycosyltransferase involved in cell wall biosynthesis
MWEMFLRLHPRAPRLVFLGPVHGEFRPGPGVVVGGPQPDAVKAGAMAACRFLIAPGGQESFSLVMLEAWLAGRPVMVNGRCAPTVEQCRRSRGGIWFDSYGDFEVAVERLLGDESLCRSLAAAGNEYTKRTFSWESIVARYERLTSAILATAG